MKKNMMKKSNNNLKSLIWNFVIFSSDKDNEEEKEVIK